MSVFHKPVLTTETIEGLNIEKGKRYIDATAGGGGHTEKIIAKGGEVLAIDRDKDAIHELETRFEKSRNLTIVQGNFRDLLQIAQKTGYNTVDGILFDLGVSSYQLDTPERGFGLRHGTAKLDMRMNAEEMLKATDILNTYSEKELYEIISRYGEEEHAGLISKEIVFSRSNKPISTVNDLIDVISKIMNNANNRDVLSRVFQSIRITVNDELQALQLGMLAAEKLITSGGRLAVISFHSLEDRLVKRTMRGRQWNVLNKKPILSSSSEIQINSRSRSAKLRIAKRV